MVFKMAGTRIWWKESLLTYLRVRPGDYANNGGSLNPCGKKRKRTVSRLIRKTKKKCKEDEEGIYSHEGHREDNLNGRMLRERVNEL